MNLYYRHRCMHFKTTGKIIYDPDRGTMSKNVDKWTVIQVDNDIANYYRFQFEKKFGIQLLKPSWDAHISVLKGFPDIDDSIPWNWRNGEIVEVHYGHELFWKNSHVWINAYTPAIDELRNHYGIMSARDNGHISIGKFKEYQIGLIKSFNTYRDI